jgi:hypothetical protein
MKGEIIMGNENEKIEVVPANPELHEVDSIIHSELRKWMPQALSEYRPSDPDSPDVRAKFEPFYKKAAERMFYLNNSIDKARLIDKDIPSDKRIPRLQKALAIAIAYFWNGMAGVINDLEESFTAAENALDAAKRLKPVDPDSIEALRRDLLFSEIREILRSGEESSRFDLLLKAAEAGNLSVLNAVELAPFPIVPENVLQDAYKVFLQSQKNLVQAVEEAAFFRDVLTMKRFIIDRGIDQLGKSNFK